MSARIDDGGPAFPFIEPPTECNVTEGMSLRDHFAASVLPAVYECEVTTSTGFAKQWRSDVAAEAYRMADEMLKARAAS